MIEEQETTRATHFREKRIQRLSEVAEDYTELIADLIESQGQARVCDMAKEMGISHVSVLKTLKKLIREGYVIKDKNRITLSTKGQEMAAFSKKRHLILSDFLLQLGVPATIAATDVEGIEHHISKETLDIIEKHLNFLKRNAC